MDISAGDICAEIRLTRFIGGEIRYLDNWLR